MSQMPRAEKNDGCKLKPIDALRQAEPINQFQANTQHA